MSDELQREVGRHDAQIEGLENRLGKVEAKLDSVLSILNQAKGGWKTLLMVAGVAGSVGALVGKFFPFFR